jgi:phosphate transport system substrate-binding protein
LLLVTACDSSGSATRRSITVTGSTTILPIAEMAAQSYRERHPDARILVSGVGSSAGIESVSTGSSDIGTSSRDLKGEERELGLVDTPIAYDAIAVIVNRDNPVRELSTAQVRDIFAGRVFNWREVGGPDLDIGLVNRDEASGTREAFSKIALGGEPFDPAAAVLPGTGQVRSVVAGSKGAIGYISLGFVDGSVRALSIDGVVPTSDTVTSGSYPIRRVLHFLTRGAPQGLAKDYMDFVLSRGVQESVVREAGFVPVSAGMH